MKAIQAKAREDALRHELEQLERFSRFEVVRTPRNVLVVPHVAEDPTSKVGILHLIISASPIKKCSFGY